MSFEHEYFLPELGTKKKTVLCMRCSFPVKKPHYTLQQVEEYYREAPISWDRNGVKGNGIIILCPNCLEMEIEEGDKEKIKNQIILAMERELEWAGAGQPEIDDMKKAFEPMVILGRV